MNIENRYYFKDYKELTDDMKTDYYFGKSVSESYDMKKILSNYIESVSISDRINSGEFMVADPEFFINQLEYVYQKLNH